MAGVTDQGFVVKTLEDIDAELEATLKSAFGESVNLTANEPLGQAKGIWSEREAELWDLAQAVFNAFDPDSTGGTALEALASLTGTIRLPAQASTVTATLTGTPTTLVSTGKQASVADTGKKFLTVADATIAAATAWVSATAYAVGDRRKNSSNIYYCITAGTSAGSGGPTTTSSDITDGTVHWEFVGAGTGYVDVAMESLEDDSIVASAGTLTVVETAVGGWSGIYNLEDATLGRLEETEPDLRLRRKLELEGAGESTVEAIRSNILQDLSTLGVTAVTVFENTTLVTDGNGVPGKAVECLVQGGDDEVVRASVFAHKGAGIQAYGTNSGTVTDSQGIDHTIAFSRPDEVLIYVGLEIVLDPNAYPDDGDQELKDAIAAYGQTVKTGKDVVSSKLAAIGFGIEGVLDVVAKISTSISPTLTTTIAIGRRELAVYDTSRITVSSTESDP